MTSDSRDAVIVESIIRLGTSLGLETVAEGVQDSETATRLQGLGCEMAQGFYYGRPMAADRIEGLIVRGQPSLSVPSAPQGVGA
jgi:EAL domain-containing protein (putative c-di-GMP-specific phosphodiesterase class I)